MQVKMVMEQHSWDVSPAGAEGRLTMALVEVGGMELFEGPSVNPFSGLTSGFFEGLLFREL